VRALELTFGGEAPGKQRLKHGSIALFAPDVRPIAEGEQTNWQLHVAFVLKSIENARLFGIVILPLAAGYNWLRKRVSGHKK